MDKVKGFRQGRRTHEVHPGGGKTTFFIADLLNAIEEEEHEADSAR